jgi:hypothetical protein
MWSCEAKIPEVNVPEKPVMARAARSERSDKRGIVLPLDMRPLAQLKKLDISANAKQALFTVRFELS